MNNDNTMQEELEEVLVSVIMGTYNGARTICRAIDSMLNQTYKNLEVIICDDCSVDNTFDLICSTYANNKRVIICRNIKNRGLAYSLNHCLQLAKGELIARMDDDDFSHPTRIETQVRFILKHQYAVVGCSQNYYDENGIWGCTSSLGERTKEDIFKGRVFSHPTVIIKRYVLEEVGGYTVNRLNRRGQDFDLWCKIYLHGYKGYNLSDILLDYNESQNSVRRRKFQYRWDGFLKKLYWRKKMHLPFYYVIYAYKEILAGLLPKRILLYRRRKIAAYD